MNKAETKTGFEKLQKPSRMRTVLEVEKPKESKQTFKRLLQYFVDERKLLIGLLLAVTMGVLCNVYAPKLQSQAIDSITQGAFGVLTQRLGLMLAIYLIYGLTSLFQSRLSAHLSQRVVKTMRKDLFDKIIDLPIKYVDQHAHGDLMSRMTNDVENISDTISQSLSSLVAGDSDNHRYGCDDVQLKLAADIAFLYNRVINGSGYQKAGWMDAPFLSSKTNSPGASQRAD